MKYTITGSLGHISKPLTEALVRAGHEVTVITSKESNAPAIGAMGAKAAVGSVNDVAFLTEAFSGADAVYTMVPPKWDATDWKAYIGTIGENYAKAIKAAHVPYVVNLSSIGAHLAEGAGPVSGLFRVEKALNQLQGVNIRHLRPAYFYYNLLANINLVKQANIIGGNNGDAGTIMPVTDPSDIAEVAAEELTRLDFTGQSIRYIASDEVTNGQVAATLGAAIGKPELPWVEFSDDQSLQGMIAAGLAPEVAKNYVEMNAALRKGDLTRDYFSNRPEALGTVKLQDFAGVFASAYKASLN